VVDAKGLELADGGQARARDAAGGADVAQAQVELELGEGVLIALNADPPSEVSSEAASTASRAAYTVCSSTAVSVPHSGSGRPSSSRLAMRTLRGTPWSASGRQAREALVM
jgi:hypothetical protein